MMLLRLENVSKHYGGVAALRNLSCTIDEGETVSLMGANGAGKTTAFSLIAGTQRPSSGEIWFDGVRISQTWYRPYLSDRSALCRAERDGQPCSRRTLWS